MIRTIIIEDEKPAVRRLEKLLGLFSDLEVVASLNSVEEAVDWFQKIINTIQFESFQSVLVKSSCVNDKSLG